MSKKVKKETAEVAVIYARYSSHNQKDCSIEQQVEACTNYAKKLGLQIINVYADRAISGKTDKRPNFQKMLKDATSGSFKYVIAWKSNRIGRNMLQTLANEERLKDAGVKCIYAEESFEDNASGRFALRTMMNMNQFYIENMAEDIKRGLRDNAIHCKVTNGSIPYGYETDKDLHLVLNDEKSKIVKEIFERISVGENYAKIARDFNKRGIKTSKGKDWGKNSFCKIVGNERYKGIYIYDDIRIEGGIPRIVSDELFDMVQNILDNKLNRGRKSDYALSGKIFCGECHSNMVGISGTSHTGAMHYYYACANKRKHRCTKSNVLRDTIEKLVTETIVSCCLTDETIDWIADQTMIFYKQNETESAVKILEEELSTVERSLANLLKAIELGIISETTNQRIEELEEQKASLKSKISIEKAQTVSVTKEQIVLGLKAYRNGDIEDKEFRNELFAVFLKNVYVYDNKLKICFTVAGKLDNLEVKSTELTNNIDDIELQKVRLGLTKSQSSRNSRTLYQIGKYTVCVVDLV